MSGRADLHTHTLYSDGVLAPADLLKIAKESGVDTISITDHDTIGGLQEALQITLPPDIEIVPGVEISSIVNDVEVHILGYFIDYRNKMLLEVLEMYRNERLKRAERIVHKLNKLNIPLKIESVLATSTGESVGRPHIATALFNEGHTDSYREAFHKYIGNGRPAFEQKSLFSPEETIHLIDQTGGLSFIAHPGSMLDDESLIQLIKIGIDGIEVIHPNHSQEKIDFYRGIVNEYCLLECGGSDFHGGLKGDDHTLGKFTVPTSAVDLMKQRL